MDGSLNDRTYLSPNSSTFGFGDAGTIERSFVATGRRFRSELLHLLDDLASGSINVHGFTRDANTALAQAYTDTFSLGALSVDPFHIMTLEDMDIITNEIVEEQRFLKGFAKEIGSGFYVLNPQIRARLYLYSLRGMFELGRLHAQPSSPYDWILGDTHHCDPCISAANGGPYQLTRFTHHGLPVLPGIPGSGDLCLGLTRCGCTIRPRSAFPLPNQDLQDKMRGLLAEIADGYVD